MAGIPSRDSGPKTSQAWEEGTPMFRTIRSPLLVALAVLLVASAVALAADETTLGIVTKLDVQKERITLQSTEKSHSNPDIFLSPYFSAGAQRRQHSACVSDDRGNLQSWPMACSGAIADDRYTIRCDQAQKA